MNLAKLKELQECYFSASRDYRNAMEQAFGEMLKEGDFIDLVERGEAYFYLTYDGGNHPEYASNLVSQCFGVGKRNGKVYFRIEEDEEYEIDRVTNIDLDYIVYELINILKMS